MEWRVWSVECVECKVWSASVEAKCGVKVWSVKRGVESVECGV